MVEKKYDTLRHDSLEDFTSNVDRKAECDQKGYAYDQRCLRNEELDSVCKARKQ